MHVIVGLSGGVDSAVAALLLQREGLRVSGLFMQNWASDESGYCTAADDFQAARAVADELGIPLHRVDFSAEYRERVFAAFLRQLAAGRTPNPDVLCNREIKFAPFVEHARRLGADLVATGHYARLGTDADGEPRLLRAADENKDQTYFLAGVERAQLRGVRFPLGTLTKPEVRALATAHGLPNHRRKDSTGICFIGERPFAAFVAEHLPPQPGPIVSDSGERLGEHAGLHFFTLGQRKGVGVGGVRGAAETPWYVVGKEPAERLLRVSQNPAHPGLVVREVRTDAFHWLRDPFGDDTSVAGPLPLSARLRHRQPLTDCWVRQSGEDGHRVQAHFEVPQRAATPGQFLALYDGEECLGCGEISAS